MAKVFTSVSCAAAGEYLFYFLTELWLQEQPNCKGAKKRPRRRGAAHCAGYTLTVHPPHEGWSVRRPVAGRLVIVAMRERLELVSNRHIADMGIVIRICICAGQLGATADRSGCKVRVAGIMIISIAKILKHVGKPYM